MDREEFTSRHPDVTFGDIVEPAPPIVAVSPPENGEPDESPPPAPPSPPPTPPGPHGWHR